MNVQATKAFTPALVLVFLITATTAAAYAQMPGITEVSGNYVNENAGVEITFPAGWSGFEIAQTSETILVSTSPGGLTESDPATMKTINLLITAKGGRDANDPSSLTQDTIDCSPPSIQSRTVAGVQGTEVTVDCPNTSQKFMMVAVETANNIVAVMYMAPTAAFDSEVGSFDSAVASLQVQGAASTGGSSSGGSSGGDGGIVNTTLELESVVQAVLVSGENVELNVMSNSTISNFRLEEQQKRLSFTVDGQTGTQGSTEIPIGKVLEGPYTVAIDGQATTAFEVANEGSADAVMTISYTHSEHDVDITGTNVVPEFPVVMVGALAAIVGVVALIGRTKLFGVKI